MRAYSTALATSAALLSTCAVAALVYADYSSATSQPLLDWNDRATVDRGMAIYGAQCMSCHGPIGELASSSGFATAYAPSHGVDGHTWEHPDYALVQLTKSGEVAELCQTPTDTTMPIFEQSLSDRDIVDVLSFIKSTWPADVRNRHDELNRLYSSQNAAFLKLLDL